MLERHGRVQGRLGGTGSNGRRRRVREKAKQDGRGNGESLACSISLESCHAYHLRCSERFAEESRFSFRRQKDGNEEVCGAELDCVLCVVC